MYHEDLQGMQMLYHAAGVTNVVREDVILLVVNRKNDLERGYRISKN